VLLTKCKVPSSPQKLQMLFLIKLQTSDESIRSFSTHSRKNHMALKTIINHNIHMLSPFFFRRERETVIKARNSEVVTCRYWNSDEEYAYQRFTPVLLPVEFAAFKFSTCSLPTSRKCYLSYPGLALHWMKEWGIICVREVLDLYFLFHKVLVLLIVENVN